MEKLFGAKTLKERNLVVNIENSKFLSILEWDTGAKFRGSFFTLKLYEKKRGSKIPLKFSGDKILRKRIFRKSPSGTKRRGQRF